MILIFFLISKQKPKFNITLVIYILRKKTLILSIFLGNIICNILAHNSKIGGKIK